MKIKRNIFEKDYEKIISKIKIKMKWKFRKL